MMQRRSAVAVALASRARLVGIRWIARVLMMASNRHTGTEVTG